MDYTQPLQLSDFPKLFRRDMFDGYYSEVIPIHDYDKKGRDTLEDQEKFD